LPENVDDNMYLAAASKAAETDKASGAYDPFLFSEDLLQQMPFEDSVDDHLSLIQIRLRDRGRREVLLHQKAVLDAKSKLSKSENLLSSLETRVGEQQANLVNQVEILEGSKPGKAGLFWNGSPSELTSKTETRLKLVLPIALFAIVGLVDLGIIINSFTKIPGFKFLEAIIFTAPAVGVQLVFPHFIGNRINLVMHGHSKKLANIIEIVLLSVLWLTFVIVMTEIRMNYIKVTAATEEPLSLSLELFLYIGNALMLVGLGMWLLLTAARSNHHEREHRRLSLAIHTLREKLAKQQSKQAAILAEIPTLELSLKVSQESYADAVEASRVELADAAKSVYRRSLINQMGAVEFTSAYMQEKPKPRARKVT
jgi:hypothetical protein